MRIKSPLLLATAAVLSMGLVACSNSEEASSGSDTSASSASSAATETAAAAAFPRTVDTVDGEGNEKSVTIEEAPERIVSASVTLTGSLLALDAPVVATGGGSGSAMYTADEGFGSQWADVAREQGVESMYRNEPSAETILAQDPDLVVMSNVGQDSATDVYAQIAEVVPVIVIDYSDKSWQEITTQLGEATGREDRAEEVIADYEEKVAQAKEEITLPEQPTNIVTVAGTGGMNFFTSESAQGRVFEDLGFELATPSADLAGGTSQSANRGDIIGVSAENLPVALTGETVFVLELTDEALTTAREKPELAQAPAVVANRVVGLPAEAFRIDYFSASDLVDYLVEQYGTK